MYLHFRTFYLRRRRNAFWQYRAVFKEGKHIHPIVIIGYGSAFDAPFGVQSLRALLPTSSTFLFLFWGTMPSVLWRCWLGGRKGIRPVKTEWWGVGVVICLERGTNLHMAQLMPLPLTVSCFSKIQIAFTFLVPAHPGSPGQRAVKRG